MDKASQPSAPLRPGQGPAAPPGPGRVRIPLFIAFGVVLFFSTTAAFLLGLVWSSPSPTPTTPPILPGPNVPPRTDTPTFEPAYEWYSHDDYCFVDANGDEFLDPIGRTGIPVEQNYVSALDGVSGSRLWSTSKAFVGPAHMFCVDKNTILIGTPDFQLHALAARGGAQIWSARLTDKARDVTVGDGCVSVKTHDRKVFGVSLATGTAQACPVPEEPKEGLFGLTRPPPEVIRAGDLEITLKSRKEGTPVLTVQASRGGDTVWEQPLSVKRTGDGLFAVMGGTVFVAGADLVEPKLIVTGLDPATGSPIYSRKEASTWSANTGRLEAQAPHIYIPWGCGLHAYDPRSGQRVWHLGGR
jgi:PQQ-like domain